MARPWQQTAGKHCTCCAREKLQRTSAPTHWLPRAEGRLHQQCMLQSASAGLLAQLVGTPSTDALEPMRCARAIASCSRMYLRAGGYELEVKHRPS